MTGPQVYNAACLACHGAGIGGAPKTGDAAAWAPRIAQGQDILTEHVINGYQGEAGYMPPKGGRVDLSDEEILAAMTYMLEESQLGPVARRPARAKAQGLGQLFATDRFPRRHVGNGSRYAQAIVAGACGQLQPVHRGTEHAPSAAPQPAVQSQLTAIELPVRAAGPLHLARPRAGDTLAHLR